MKRILCLILVVVVSGCGVMGAPVAYVDVYKDSPAAEQPPENPPKKDEKR